MRVLNIYSLLSVRREYAGKFYGLRNRQAVNYSENLRSLLIKFLELTKFPYDGTKHFSELRVGLVQVRGTFCNLHSNLSAGFARIEKHRPNEHAEPR